MLGRLDCPGSRMWSEMCRQVFTVNGLTSRDANGCARVCISVMSPKGACMLLVSTHIETPILQGQRKTMFIKIENTKEISVESLELNWRKPRIISVLNDKVLHDSVKRTVLASRPEYGAKINTNMSRSRFLHVYLRVDFDFHHSLAPGKLHNFTTWLDLKYKTASGLCRVQHSSFAFRFQFYAPACSPFSNLVGQIKKSHAQRESISYSKRWACGGLGFRDGAYGVYWQLAKGFSGAEVVHEYYQVEFKKRTRVEMVSTLNVPNGGYASFALHTSEDGIHWKAHPNTGVKDTVFWPGGFGSYALNAPAIPVESRFLRILARQWNYNPVAEFKFWGCVVGKHTDPTPLDAGAALGLESGDVLDEQLTASFHGPRARYARLNSDPSWCAGANQTSGSHLQVDLRTPHVIRQVALQGFNNITSRLYSAVPLLHIQYSVNGVTYENYTENGLTKTFLGNNISYETVWHRFSTPFVAQIVRFVVKDCVGECCLRVEIYGEKDDLNNTRKEFIHTGFLLVHKRSLLVDTTNRLLFFCSADIVSFKTSFRTSGFSYCFWLENSFGSQWTGFGPKLLSIYGFNTASRTLYGVSRNRRSHVIVTWPFYEDPKAVSVQEWERVKNDPHTTLATEIPVMPRIGISLESPFPLVVSDGSGNHWGASGWGLLRKFSSQTKWTLIASWNSEDTDFCRNDRCQNGGTCENGEQTFICHCMPGFQGKNCQEEINECQCVRGQCTDLHVDYSCACPAGYEGKSCEINLNDCLNHECQNSATCADGANTYYCRCKAGFAGMRCNLTKSTDFGNYYYSSGYWRRQGSTLRDGYDSSLPLTWHLRRNDDTRANPHISPRSDHTTTHENIAYGWYARTVIGRDAINSPNATAKLKSKEFSSTVALRHMNFSYHMYGKDTGNLTVLLAPTHGNATKLWHRAGATAARDWYSACVNIESPESYRIVFEATYGGGADRQGEIALDDIYFRDGNCTAPG